MRSALAQKVFDNEFHRQRGIAKVMSMVAIFACSACKKESTHGRFKGEEMYVPQFRCADCRKKTTHSFVRYQSEVK